MFTKEQKEYIKNNYDKMSYKDISKYFNGAIKDYQISSWVRYNLGYTKFDRIFSEKDKLFIKDNYLKMTYGEMAKILNFSEKQVRSKAKSLGLKKNRNFNDLYFENIDEPLKAYFLGFIYADGYVIYNEERHNYEFGFELQEQDEYVLNKLNSELGNCHKIATRPEADIVINGYFVHKGISKCLRIYSKRFVLSLMKYNILPNKSYRDEIPIIDEKYFFDFLRGYIDGDGYFTISKKNIYNIGLICHSEIVLSWVKLKLEKFNILSSIYSHDSSYRLNVTAQKYVKALINHLYYKDDLFCLKRKYKIIKPLLERPLLNGDI